MKRKTKNIIVLLLMLLSVTALQAQVDKGVTSSGKEVDCSTIDPSKDKTVSEHGAIVTHPRLTRYGEIIRKDCFCPFDLVGITDTVYCSSVKMVSELSYLDSRILPLNPKILVYTDAERTNCVGTITATLIEHADGKDTIAANITGLNCYTRYYFRLVATNSTECAFDWTDSTRDLSTDTVTTCSVWTTNSNEHSPAAGRIDSVYDHQGNSYAVVQIGNQCWLRENMRATTSPSSGSTILVKSNFVKSRSSKCATYYEYDSTRYAKFGVLYNWCAAVDTFYNNGEPSHPELASDVNHVSTNWNVTLTNPRRGICPEGWHIPSNAEWNTLADSAGLTNNHFTGKLATGCDWLPSGSGPTNPKAGNYEYSERNSSAFSALPAGSFYADDFAGFGEQLYFWSTQTFLNERAYARSFLHDIDSLYRQDKYRNNAFSVRCLRDNFNPSVTLCGDCEEGSIFIKAVTNVDSCALLSSTKSFVASKKNPAVDDKFAGLDPGKYYVVSISSTGNTVTDSVTLTGKVHVPCVGTAHTGTEISTGVYANNEWGSAAGIIDSVSDHQGNVYEVVQIGNQCWLKENMRCTTSPNGLLTQSTTSTSTAAYRNAYYYVPANNITLSGVEYTPEQFTRKYGIFYNFLGAVDTNVYAFTNDIYTHPRRGICPQGWHIPSEADWLVLEKEVLDGVSGLSEDSLGNNIRGTGGGRLTTSCDWVVALSSTNPGNYLYAERNSTNFSALPSGMFSNPGTGESAIFWTANQNAVNSGNAWVRRLMYGTKGSVRNSLARSEGASVRCLRDNAIIPAVTLCGDCEEGSIFIKAVTNVDSCALLNSTKTFVASKKNPAVDDKFAGLGTGKYYVVSISSTGNTVTDSVTLTGKVHVPCVGMAHTGTEISTGVYANKEWGSAAGIIDSVSDHQGNVYEVVQIGNQCWLKENMRCTISPNGLLTQSTTSTSTAAYRNAYYYVPANNITLSGVEYTPEQFTRKYGIFYNFLGAVDTNVYAFTNDIYTHPRRGICPQGWHIPSEADWLVLEKEVLDGVSGLSEDSLGDNIRGTGGGRLTTSCDWVVALSSTNPGNYLYAERNSTNFSALPSGMFSNPGTGESAIFWTANQNAENSGNAWVRRLMFGAKGSVRNSLVRAEGASVRCVRDVPQVSAAADSVSCTSMTVSAKVVGLGTITGKTVCAYKNADYSDASPVCAAAADMRVSNDSIYATIKNLDCNTRYYVKITATDGANNTEITISDSTRDMSFENLTTCTVGSVRALGIGTDLSHEHGYNGSTTEIDSVYDHEGNAYAVVQIGEQCWLKENMRAVTRPNGDTILQVLNTSSDLSLSSPRVYYYENDINNYYKYGCLYNFPAAMDIDDLSKSFPYPHRGICPEGWHVPSDEDWTTLATNAGVGVNTGGTGAGKLAGGCDWRVSPNATAPGNYSYSDRNATSFYALPAAGCHGSFHSSTAYANFWSTLVENANNQVYYRDISFEHEYMGRVLNPRNDAYSVRCMRDAENTTLTLTITANPSSDTVHLCGKTSATVTYTANLEGGTAGSYSWSISGGSATASTSNTYTVTYTAAGNYTVTCTAAGVSATKQVPIASGGVPATLELCEDCPTGSIMVKDGNCTTVTWVNNADPTKTATTAGTKYTVLNQSAAIPAGVYTVTGTNNDGCTVTETATLCEYVSHPCTVTSLRAGTALADGKYANKEYGSGTQLDFVSDHEGNMYRVVEIGTQCWLAENMRATTSPSTHSKILMNPMILSTSSKSAAWYKYDSTKYSIVGVLYNWCAAVDTFYNDGQASHPELANDPNHVSTVWSITLPVGNRRGICPEGWHVPTRTEWETLVTNACGADNKSAGKLAGSCLWYANSVDNAPGNYSYADRNVTGFAAIPAGSFGGGFGNITWYPYFWSTSLSGSGQAYCRTLDAEANYVAADYYNLSNGHSVRCVRNN